MVTKMSVLHISHRLVLLYKNQATALQYLFKHQTDQQVVYCH